MQQALDLKNQTLAQLQGQATLPRVVRACRDDGDGTRRDLRSDARPPAPAAASAGTPAPAAPAAGGTAPAGATPAAEAPKPAALRSLPTTKAAAPKAAPAEPQGFFADLLSNTPNWALGAGALADPRRHRRADRHASPERDQVRGQHHLGHRHQDEHGIRLDGRRRRQHRRQLARFATSAARAWATSTPTRSIRSPKPRCISPTGATRRPRRS